MDIQHYSGMAKDASTLVNLGHIAHMQDAYNRGLNGLRVAETVIAEKGYVTQRDYEAECLQGSYGVCCQFDTLRDNGLTRFDHYVKVYSPGWHVVTEEEMALREDKWVRQYPYRRREWYTPRLQKVYSVIGSENLVSESKIEELKHILGEDYVEDTLKPRYEGMGTYGHGSNPKGYILIPEAVAAYRTIAETILAIDLD